MTESEVKKKETKIVHHFCEIGGFHTEKDRQRKVVPSFQAIFEAWEDQIEMTEASNNSRIHIFFD
jgi:hypothetical protein